MAKTLIFAGLAMMLPVLPAKAAPATPEEAARLAALFETYVGHPAAGEPSSVTVVPKGESYVATLDLKRALQPLSSFGVAIEPYTSTTVLTPLPDGTWRATSDASPPLVVHAGQQTITTKSATSTFDGIYDPKLFAFKQLATVVTGYDVLQEAPTSTQDRRNDKVTLDLTGAAADGGTVTTGGHYLATGTAVGLLIKAPPPATGTANPALPSPIKPSTSISFTMPTSSVDLGLDRLHAKDVLDIWAFLVAHPNRDTLLPAQDQLRSLVKAGLPFVTGFKETAVVDSIAANTPIGPVTLTKLAGGLDLQGLAGTGRLASKLSYGGLSIPPGQLPGWSVDFVPTAMALDVAVDGFHAMEAATEAVNDMDLKSDHPLTPDQSAKVGHLFWPEAGGTLTVGPSRLTSKLLDLKFEGHASLGPVPAGQMTIVATGLDKAIAALQAASGSDASAAQMLGPLVLAKNLAKPQADGSLVWVVAAGNGPLTVNGAPLQ